VALLFLLKNQSNHEAPVIVKFKEKPSDDIWNSLKSSGLKWNPLRQEWEGLKNIEELTSLLALQKASVTEVDLSTKK